MQMDNLEGKTTSTSSSSSCYSDA